MNIEVPGGQAAGFFTLRKFQGITNRFGEVEVIPGTEEVREFPNLITDAGLAAQMTMGFGDFNQIGQSGTLLYYALVGNGTAPESTTSTALSSYLAGSAAYNSGGTATSTTTPPYYDTVTWNRRFSPGFLGSSNVNITEVGMGSGNNSGILFTRSLIKDSGGTPISMTITPIDYLDIYYSIRLYKYAGPDITGQVSVAGVQTDFVLRSAEITATVLNRSDYVGVVLQNGSYVGGFCLVYPNTSTLGSITSTPTGMVAGGTDTVNNIAYTSGYVRQSTASFSISQGNAPGGIKCILFRTTRGNFQVSFSPPIPKDNTKTLVFTFSIGPISRYTP